LISTIKKELHSHHESSILFLLKHGSQSICLLKNCVSLTLQFRNGSELD